MQSRLNISFESPLGINEDRPPQSSRASQSLEEVDWLNDIPRYPTVNNKRPASSHVTHFASTATVLWGIIGSNFPPPPPPPQTAHKINEFRKSKRWPSFLGHSSNRSESRITRWIEYKTFDMNVNIHFAKIL